MPIYAKKSMNPIMLSVWVAQLRPSQLGKTDIIVHIVNQPIGGPSRPKTSSVLIRMAALCRLEAIT